MRRTVLRGMGLIVLSVAGVFVVLCAGLYLFQPYLLYFPEKEILAGPEAVGLRYESVSFRARDGVSLAGWFVPADNAGKTLLFCHGNGGNISHRLEYLRIFHDLGLNVFIFDYRGYGRSEGRPDEAGTYRDAEAAWDYLLGRGTAPEEIIIYGKSLGGAVAAWLARNRSPSALILASTFTSIPEIASDIYPFLPVKLLCRYSYNTLGYLRNISCPVLVMHSPDDEIAPFSHGERLYAAARNPVEFLKIRGDHNGGVVLSRDVWAGSVSRLSGQ